MGRKLTNNFKWIILELIDDSTKIYKIFDNLVILPNSEIFYMTKLSNYDDGNNLDQFKIEQGKISLKKKINKNCRKFLLLVKEGFFSVLKLKN